MPFDVRRRFSIAARISACQYSASSQRKISSGAAKRLTWLAIDELDTCHAG